jgi:D-alanyl-lipoteichoic acid acyltransferase DltB (MBOAT superfamily)
MEWKGWLHNLVHLLQYNPKEPMLFNTALFIYLFLVLLFFYQFVYHRTRPRVLYLTLFSLFFYYKSGGMFFLLLISSTIIDFNLARWIFNAGSKPKKTFLLVVSLVVNLGLLFYFKYTNFFIQTVNDLNIGHLNPVNVILPVGISFYTFQVLSYTIDIYRGQLTPSKSILDFAFYICFFPHLVAGPIVRAVNFLPQIHKDVILTKEEIGQALFLILTGLVKKAIISDYISVNFVDRVFDAPTLYSGFENLMGVYGYAMQIYCDFSGYSDMAIGIALLLGYRLGVNFDLPYQSSSITEFWRRWHISLSSWLRDYLYIPLGGNRKGKVRQYVNLMLTMLLGGLWHGASWNFVFWGLLHGVALALDKLKDTFLKVPKNIFTKVLGVLFTFHFVCLCWIYFRAKSFTIADQVISQIFTQFHGSLAMQWIVGYKYVFVLMLLGYLTHFIPTTTHSLTERKLANAPIFVKSLLIVMVVWFIIQIKSSDIQPFIYFQF